VRLGAVIEITGEEPFFNKVAGPIVNKTFECGMVP